MHMEMGMGMVTLMIRVVKGAEMLVGRLGSYLLELMLKWNFKFFFQDFSISNNEYNVMTCIIHKTWALPILAIK